MIGNVILFVKNEDLNNYLFLKNKTEDINKIFLYFLKGKTWYEKVFDLYDIKFLMKFGIMVFYHDIIL